METPLTLRILFSFQPINDREKEVFKFDEKIVAEMMHKLDKNLDPILPRHPFMECIIAPPRSGKTCFLMNKIFRLYPDDYFDEII